MIRYSQLKTEIIEKLGEYVEFITISNTEHPEIEKIDELLKGFQKCDFLRNNKLFYVYRACRLATI